MQFVHTGLIIGLSLGSFYIHADPTDNVAAQAFFENYIVLSDAYDDKVTDLYPDNSVIRTCRRHSHGLERSMKLSGSQRKALRPKPCRLPRRCRIEAFTATSKYPLAGTRR